MKVLFICNQNQNRSKTAEELFKGRFETKSAGLYNENPVTEKQLKWADAVIVMEDEQRSEIAKRFPKLYLRKRILSINIPDVYHYNQPQLIELLESKSDDLFSTLLLCYAGSHVADATGPIAKAIWASLSRRNH